MKRLIALLLCVFGSLAAPLRADVELSFDFYYDTLSPMGEWVEVAGYGYVWHPNGVDADWAPYTDGYWTYTDAGWTWVSYEEWGGICYHYGRWANIQDYGWCWVPGYEWGPAWVSWRHSDEYVGWAPLPPECDWVADRGVSIWVDTHYDIGPRWYSFCRIRDFGAPVIRSVCLPRIRNFEICFSTVNVTNITYNRDYGCVFNGGFDYDYIRTRSYRPIPTLKLVQNTTNVFVNNTTNVFVNSQRGNALVVAAPRVAANAKQFTRKPAIRRSFDRNAVARGWSGVDKPETRDRLVSKMRAETKGLTPDTKKAQPVKQEALAFVPKEAKLDAPAVGLKRLPAERGSRETARDAATERLTPAERERAEKMRQNGRGEAPTAEVPAETNESKTKGRAPVAGTEERQGGLRKRPDREGAATAEIDRPAGTPPAETQVPGEGRGRDLVKPNRVGTAEIPATRSPDRVLEREDRGIEKAEKPGRAAEMRDAQENARRQAQSSAENAARARQENGARENAARDAAERQAKQREQAEAAQDAAERAGRQREAAENAGRATEMKRLENANRENAAREQAASAAAARRAQVEAAQAQQSRASEQAEAIQRQNAQRAESARRAAAADQQNENARRQNMERQNEARQQQAQQQAQRQAEAQRERATQARQQQQQQQAEMARERAMENQQRAAAAQAQAQSQARAQAQAEARAEAQQQQRAAAAAAQAQAQAQAAARQQSQDQGRSQQDSDDRKKKR